MEKQYRHCERGLALYFGAECEFQEYFRNGPPKGGGEWKTTIMKLDSYLNSCFKTIGYKEPILYLRPLSSMTEEERKNTWNLIDTEIECDDESVSAMLDSVRIGACDYLRSRSFDLGGPCEVSTDGGKTWTETWVESYLAVGLAEEVDNG